MVYPLPIAGVGNVFCAADQFETKIFSRTGLQKTTNVQQWIFITTRASYYNFDSMRTLNLFSRNETLPPRNYGTQRHPQRQPQARNRLDVSLTSSLFRGFVFVGAISENLNSHK